VFFAVIVVSDGADSGVVISTDVGTDNTVDLIAVEIPVTGLVS